MSNEIDSINTIQPLQDVRFRAEEEIPAPEVNQVPPVGRTLSQVFEEDKEECPSKKRKIEAAALQLQEDLQTASLWSRFKTWFKGTDSTDSVSQNDLTASPGPAPIQFAPVLEEPVNAQPPQPPLPPPPVNSVKPLSTKEVEEGLALMSSQSIEKILELIMIYQIKLQEEAVEVAETTFNKFKEVKELQENLLHEVKTVLEKDERVASVFNTTQKIAFAASIVSGIVAGAMKFGFTAIFGQGIAGQVVNFVGTAGPFITAGIAGSATALRAYFQRSQSEQQAKRTTIEHKDQLYGSYVDDSRNLVFSHAESSSNTQERWIQLTRNNHRKIRSATRQLQP
jgi:hypothetical protein